MGVLSNPLARTRTFLPRLSRFALPAMIGMFGIYVVMHSPLRDLLSVVRGGQSQNCYFFCLDALQFGRIIDGVAAWILVIVALLAAWAIADGFEGASYEWPLVFGLSSLAFVAVPAAIFGGLGSFTGTALLRPPAGPLLTALPAALAIIVSVRHGWRPHRIHIAWHRPTGLVALVAVLAIGLLVASAMVSLMHPLTGGDALSYHAPLAVFLWQDGNLSAFLDRAPGTWALAHPGTAELWFGLLMVAGGEALGDLGQLPFALLGSAAVAAFSRRLGLGRGSALLAACAFLLSPLVVMQIGMPLNDVAGAAVLMATIVLTSAPPQGWTASRLMLIGLGLGMVATAKLALLPCVAGVGLYVIGVALWRARRANIRLLAAWAAIVGLAFCAAVAPWWARNIVRYGNPLYPAGIPLIGRGVFVSDFGSIDKQFVPTAAAWPLYPLVEPHYERSGNGALFIVGLVPGLALAALRGRRRPLIPYVLATALMLPAWWALTLHEPRFFVALFGLGFAFLPWSLLALPKSQRRLGSMLVAVAAIFSTLVTLDQALLPFAQQPNTRLEFYDRVWGVDPVVAALPESEGILNNTGYASAQTAPYTEYAAYYPLLGPGRTRLVIPADVGRSGAPIDETIDTMRRNGIHYVYVTALPENRATVEEQYDASHFELVHMSTIEVGEKSGPRRYLYRPTTAATEPSGIRRYLYRLK